MSLFESLSDDLEKYQPKLIKVKMIGNIRSGETNEGNLIISMDVEDKKQLPVNEKRLATRQKRVCFLTERVAKHYLDHPDGNPEEKEFMMPMVQPDKTNFYWVRQIYSEPSIPEKKGK